MLDPFHGPAKFLEIALLLSGGRAAPGWPRRALKAY
jgi:hypothetical protein